MTVDHDSPPLVVEPTYLGPTWHKGEDGNFVLPRYTLGWAVLDWIAEWLHEPRLGTAFMFTDEQARFVLWWYAINEEGDFIYYDGVLQRLKGWGKDPIVAALAMCELVGPCRFGGWGDDEEPIVVPQSRAWIQVAAVNESQTQTTMSLFVSMIPERTRQHFKLEVGRTQVLANNGAGRIEAVTKSPRALEGKPSTFVIRNETHHWIASQLGHDMADVIERNTAKGAGGTSRALSITNAYDPSEDSVAQRAREAYLSLTAPEQAAQGLLYDSLEAPDEAPLNADWIEPVLQAVRGDSVWVPIHRFKLSILDPRQSPGKSRRFYYNQVVAAEDAWLDPRDISQCEHPELGEGMSGSDLLPPARPDDELVLALDCSKSDDSTALVGVYMSDGHAVTLGVWQKPKNDRGGANWTVNPYAVDERVRAVFDSYKVVAFFGDPSHAKNDEDDTRMWDPFFDRWHEDFAERLRLWAVQSGNGRHSIMWDMTSPERVMHFTDQCERTLSEFEEHTLTHDGHPALVAHLRNAKRFPNRYGVSIWKGSRESSRKIDLAVTLIIARMVRRLIRIKGVTDTPKPTYGTIWGG